jgi:hypothetical protein|tara:strand:+ start:259 stop:543 length:285 start_codon:yes stop_codon:yes gene_type:complete
MTEGTALRDPTAEIGSALRQRLAPPESLDGRVIGLLDIGKERSDEFLDHIEGLLGARGLTVKRYSKPSPTTLAADYCAPAIATECDVVVEGLAD